MLRIIDKSIHLIQSHAQYFQSYSFVVSKVIDWFVLSLQ